LLFLDRNFQTTNARKLTRGSKEADFRLVFIFKKKFKNYPLGWGPGPSECGPNKSTNLHLFLTSPKNKLKSKTTQFF